MFKNKNLKKFDPAITTGSEIYHLCGKDQIFKSRDYRIFELECPYRSGTVNSKSFIGKVLLQIKWKFK